MPIDGYARGPKPRNCCIASGQIEIASNLFPDCARYDVRIVLQRSALRGEGKDRSASVQRIFFCADQSAGHKFIGGALYYLPGMSEASAQTGYGMRLTSFGNRRKNR